MSNEAFYNSPVWRRASRVFMQSKHYVCERCGGVGEVAHHKVYLNRWNVRQPEIALNMDNLECLCLACHNAEHGASGDAIAPGLMFDGTGDIVKSE